MLPLSPYTPKTTQTVSTQTVSPSGPREGAGGVDYDWVVRLCFGVIIVPKLLLIFQVLIHSIRGVESGLSSISSILSTGVSILVQSFLFFILLQFIEKDRDYKKALIVFLASTIFLAMLFGVSV